MWFVALFAVTCKKDYTGASKITSTPSRMLTVSFKKQLYQSNCDIMLKTRSTGLPTTKGKEVNSRLELFHKIQKQPQGVFVKKNALRNFAKITGKNLCQSLFFNNLAVLRPATLIKKRFWHMCFFL